MVLLKRRVLLTLMWTFTFCELFGVLHADVRCSKGQRVHRDGWCEECPDGYYQPIENESQQCLVCTNCNIERGSMVESECRKIANRICRCRPGFVSRETGSATCKCDIGSGLKKTGNLQECHKCEDGFFSKSIDSSCKKWNECKATGVKVNGTKTKDTTCNDRWARGSPVATRPTSNKSPSLTTHVASNAAEMTSTSQKLHLRNDTAHPTLAVITKATGRPFTLNQPDGSIGMPLLLAFGIIGLLILMTLTCKLNIVHCIQNYKKPAVNAQDSLWRSPVEESGDSSPSTLVKLNPGEL